MGLGLRTDRVSNLPLPALHCQSFLIIIIIIIIIIREQKVSSIRHLLWCDDKRAECAVHKTCTFCGVMIERAECAVHKTCTFCGVMIERADYAVYKTSSVV